MLDRIVCKGCRNGAEVAAPLSSDKLIALGWTPQDDERWGEGSVICPVVLDAGDGLRAATVNELAPQWCLRFFEYAVVEGARS